MYHWHGCSEPVQHLQVAEARILSSRINCLDGRVAAGVCVISSHGATRIDVVVDAYVIKIRKATGPVCGSTDEAEAPRLKCTAADVPQIISIAQPEPVCFRADRDGAV